MINPSLRWTHRRAPLVYTAYTLFTIFGVLLLWKIISTFIFHLGDRHRESQREPFLYSGVSGSPGRSLDRQARMWLLNPLAFLVISRPQRGHFLNPKTRGVRPASSGCVLFPQGITRLPFSGRILSQSVKMSRIFIDFGPADIRILLAWKVWMSRRRYMVISAQMLCSPSPWFGYRMGISNNRRTSPFSCAWKGSVYWSRSWSTFNEFLSVSFESNSFKSRILIGFYWRRW